MLAALDWQILPGQVVGLPGRNGAGKSTLIECLLGLRECDSGTVRVFGEDVANLSDHARARIGYVPQQADMFEWLSARQMLAYFKALYPRWNDAKVDALLERWGSDALKCALPISRLSGGEKQRLSIIRALAHDPQLLVLDEPVSALDPVGRRDFLRELVESALLDGQSIAGELRRYRGPDGLTRVVTRHDSEQLQALAARAVLALLGISVANVMGIAGTLTAVSVVSMLSMNWARYGFSMRSTPVEQAVLCLAPAMPAAPTFNRVLGRRIVVIWLCEWFVATALVLGMVWLWGGTEKNMRVALVMAFAILGGIGTSLDDFAHKPKMNNWKDGLWVLWYLLVLMVGIVHVDDLAELSAVLASQLATSLGYCAMRWRRMQRGPVAFPSGRMA